ncbi:MAG TPA: FtsX-like permease family protein, partial [Xanthomonadales bacterium]|nr:FtsX-like permease family protein [Xanthomonadales bacterium]
CADAAGLLVVRAEERQREVAIRQAVGASRWRVARHLLVEALLLAALAAVAGTLLCAGAVAALQRFVFAGAGAVAPDLVPAAFDLSRCAYVAALALAAAVATGLAPALEARAQSPVLGVRNLAADGRARSGRLRDVLLVGQLAASAVLLVLAGLIVANERRVDDLDPGFDVARVVDVTFPAPTGRASREVERVPGVAGVTAVARAPLYGRAWSAPVRVDGNDFGVGFNHVDDRYFATLGIGLARGRAFRPEEARSEAHVAIVSAAAARLLFPHGDALGRTFEVVTDLVPIATGRYEVVGIADDVASGLFLEGRDRAMVYFPTAIGAAHAGALLARVDGDVAAAQRAIVAACSRADAAVLCEPTTLAAVVERQRVPFAVAGDVATALGVAALAISCIGLYGVVAFTVARRTREIGVRVALGATPRAVVRFVLDGALRRIALGLALGLPMCVAVSWLVSSQLEVVRAFDLRAYVAMPLLLAGVAFVAALVPARRAARVAPVVGLREDG